MNNFQDHTFTGLGLTVSQFFRLVEAEQLRQFLDQDILSLMDATHGGKISDEQLRRVIPQLVNVESLLRNPQSRQNILKLIPIEKQAELEERIGHKIYQASSFDWSEGEVTRLLEFFGLVEEEILHPINLAANIITPEYGLFEHQRQAVLDLKPLLFEGDRRAVLHFPTGVGKTRTAMHLVAETLRNNDPSIVVWLSSGRELLEQAAEAFCEAWQYLGNRDLEVYHMWGDMEPNLDQLSDGFLAVGLAKAWALGSKTDQDWAVKLSSKVRLVVFDEAHQSIAKTYQQIAEELILDYRCALLGLTATPGRTWADIDKDQKLSDFFSGNKVGLNVPGPNCIDFLVANGYLAKVNFKTLFSEPGLALDKVEILRISKQLEIPGEIIQSLSMSKQYVTSVLSAIENLLDIGHLRIIVFAATVNHAEVLNAILTVRDIRSAILIATTPARERRNVIREFKSEPQDPMILINFGVLTTGFDAPKASAVVIARPTQSLVLYSQMVGRAIRGPKAGGTETCDILTVVDPDLTGFGNIAEAFLNWEDIWH